MKKKILSLLLSLSMILSCVPIISVSADGSYSGGTGTENDPYIIKTDADMETLSQAVLHEEKYSGVYFKLDADNLTRTAPIGDTTHCFNGTFDGNGNTVELAMDIEETDVALFAYLGGSSTVKNVTTTGSVTGAKCVGSVAGECWGTVTNCTNKATVYATYDKVGGIVGENHGKVISCTNEGTVTAAGLSSQDSYVGGIVGNNYNNATVQNCTNKGNVTSPDTAEGQLYVGGVAGYNYNSTVQNCTNTASVTAETNGIAGGIVGYNVQNDSSGKIYNCYNSGAVSGHNTPGGICGIAFGTVGKSMKNCVNNGVITVRNTNSQAGGIVGMREAADTIIENCYYNSDINSGMYDTGRLTIGGDGLTEDECGVSATDLVSSTTLLSLNAYAKANEYGMYWYSKTADNATTLYLDEELPANLPYIIKNNSEDYITVNTSAAKDETVTITPAEDIDEYLVITKVTVVDADNNEVTVTETDDGWEFTMPDGGVTVTAEYEYDFGSYSGGTGTENDPYIIKTAEDLETLSQALLHDEDYNGVYFKLDADGLKRTAPIGDDAHKFKGAFDGNGNSIELNIDNQSNDSQGLFAGIDGGGTIKNLKTTGIVKGFRWVGGIAADNYGTIINCINEADITSTDPNLGYCGGITGANFGNILNSYNSGTITGYARVGGVCGSLWCSTVKNCVNNGSVVKSANDVVVGGIAGRRSADGYTIENCYYNTNKNEGIYDIGVDNEQNTLTDTYCAVTETKLLSEDVLLSLNAYAKANEYGMYWYVSTENDTKKMYLDEELPENIPYNINNYYEEFVTVAAYAKADETVTVTAKEHKYLVVTDIEVVDENGKNVTVTKTDDGWTFVMPKSDVTIAAEYDYNLEKDGNTYIIKDADSLVIFSIMVYNDENGYKQNAKVVTDSVIDITGRDDFIPFGDSYSYAGVFDGNGATIKTDKTIFSYTYNAVIKNLSVEIDIDGDYVGGIANNVSNSKIINCTVSGKTNAKYFGGIALSASGNTVIANCAVNEIYTPNVNHYGGIAKNTNDDTRIINCVNYDVAECKIQIGMIVDSNYSSNLPENCFYTDTSESDIYDLNGMIMGKIVDANSCVDVETLGEYYIPSRLNEYVRENKKIGGVELKKWSVNGGFAQENEKEIYPVYYTDLTFDGFTYGAYEDTEITLTVPSSTDVAVTDKNGRDITVTKSDTEDDKVACKFTMPASAVNVSVTMDSGIEETTEIDGKEYVVVKTGEDLMKALKSISDGNSILNVYINNDVTVSEELVDDFAVNKDVVYNGTFDGGSHCITFENVSSATDFAMIGTIGTNGTVKNLTVDGTITAGNYAAVIAIINNGYIYNFKNKASVTGHWSVPVALNNTGSVCNVINYGDITGTSEETDDGTDEIEQSASYGVFYNNGTVYMVINFGQITDKSGKECDATVYGANAGMAGDMSASECGAEQLKEISAEANCQMEIYHILAPMYETMMPETAKMANEFKYWTVLLPSEDDTTAEAEIAFEDENNKAYFAFSGINDGAYQAGETVTVTFDAEDIPEGFKAIDIVEVEKYFDGGIVELTAVDDYTISFVMPENYCIMQGLYLPENVEKDSDGYYLVKSENDLEEIKTAIENGNTRINFRLANDIEYTGGPIGYGNNRYFDGIFDGNNHTITINFIDDDNYYDVYALFYALDRNAVVKNLTIDGKISVYAGYASSVAGYNSGAIVNCTNNASITNNETWEYVGGIAGENAAMPHIPKFLQALSADEEEPTYSGLIRGCTNNGELSGYYVGGIAENMYNYSFYTFVAENSATIEDCVNNADITNAIYSAGIIVNAYGNEGNDNVNVVNCVNNGDITVDLDYFHDEGYYADAGGIVVWSGAAVIDSCANNGDIKAYYAGGILEYNSEATTIINCENNGDITGTALSGCIVAYSYDEIKVLNTVNRGDIWQEGELLEDDDYGYGAFSGIVGGFYNDLVIDNCLNVGRNYTEYPYSVTYCDNEESNASSLSIMCADRDKKKVNVFSDDDDSNAISAIITNTYYMEDEEVASSNLSSDYDKSVGVEYNIDGVTPKEIAYKLNQSENPTYKKWSYDEELGYEVFADENNPVIYKVSIADGIENGEIGTGSVYAKAGETVSLDYHADEGYDLAYFTGVEVDENNNFVMPENDVEIGAYFFNTDEGYLYLDPTADENGEYTLKYGSSFQKYVLVIADYDANNVLESVQIIENNDDCNCTLKVKKGENKKFMLWENIENMNPLCEALTVE